MHRFFPESQDQHSEYSGLQTSQLLLFRLLGRRERKQAVARGLRYQPLLRRNEVIRKHSNGWTVTWRAVKWLRGRVDARKLVFDQLQQHAAR